MTNYRVGFIGDVHGHADELERMIVMMEGYGIDRLISLGDIFDRGPAAHRCLRILKDRGFAKRDGFRGSIEMVLGNHEDRNIRCHRGWPIPGRKSKPKPWSPREFDAMTPEDWAWLESRPFMIRVLEHGLNLCAVHGGFTADMLSPGWGNFDYGGRMARVGYLDEKTGRALSPMSTSKRLWADEYDGRFGRVFYGHTSFSSIRYSTHAVGLDGTKRGKIFGFVVDNEGKEMEFEQSIHGWKPPEPKKKSKPKSYDYGGYSRGYARNNRQRSLFSEGIFDSFGETFSADDEELEAFMRSIDDEDFDQGRYKADPNDLDCDFSW